MGDLTLLERVIILESAVRVLTEELAAVKAESRIETVRIIHKRRKYESKTIWCDICKRDINSIGQGGHRRSREHLENAKNISKTG